MLDCRRGVVGRQEGDKLTPMTTTTTTTTMALHDVKTVGSRQMHQLPPSSSLPSSTVGRWEEAEASGRMLRTILIMTVSNDSKMTASRGHSTKDFFELGIVFLFLKNSHNLITSKHIIMSNNLPRHRRIQDGQLYLCPDGAVNITDCEPTGDTPDGSGSSTAGSYNCTNDQYLQALTPGKHEGVVANYLSFNTDQATPHFRTRAKLLEACTGGIINFAEARDIAADPIADLGSSSSPIGKELHDAYLMIYSFTSEASNLGLLETLNDRISESTELLQYNDIYPKVSFSSVRSRISWCYRRCGEDEGGGGDPPATEDVKFDSCRIFVMIPLRWKAAWRSGSIIVLSELFFILCVIPFYFPSVGPEHGRI